MIDSVTRFLEQYEWGYPFDQRENDIDEHLLMKQLDHTFLKLESKRFEPDRAAKPEQRKRRRHFLGC